MGVWCPPGSSSITVEEQQCKYALQLCFDTDVWVDTFVKEQGAATQALATKQRAKGLHCVLQSVQRTKAVQVRTLLVSDGD